MMLRGTRPVGAWREASRVGTPVTGWTKRTCFEQTVRKYGRVPNETDGDAARTPGLQPARTMARLS